MKINAPMHMGSERQKVTNWQAFCIFCFVLCYVSFWLRKIEREWERALHSAQPSIQKLRQMHQRICPCISIHFIEWNEKQKKMEWAGDGFSNWVARGSILWAHGILPKITIAK